MGDSRRFGLSPKLNRGAPINTLIATLGMSPSAVSAGYRGLVAAGVPIDRVVVVYPDRATDREIGLGAGLLEDWFAEAGVCFEEEQVSIADANTRESALTFLRAMVNRLDEACRGGGQVHLLISGGRKGMAVLSALAAGFFEIAGMYHLSESELDDSYDTRQLLALSSAEVHRIFTESGHGKVYPLPVGYVGKRDDVWRKLAALERGEGAQSDYSLRAEQFYLDLFGKRPRQDGSEIWLARRAVETYNGFDRSKQQRFLELMRRMANPQWMNGLRRTVTGVDTDCDYVRIDNPGPERLFFYEDGRRCVLVALTHYGGAGLANYTATLTTTLRSADHPPTAQLAQLEETVTLIASLGESPAVATQAVVLGRELKELNVSRLVITYPELMPGGDAGARFIDDACQTEGVLFARQPVPKISDVDSESEVKAFARHLDMVIENERRSYPQQRIALLASGGRKSMAIATMYAAQRHGVEAVYFVTIPDLKAEDDIIAKTSLGVLGAASRQRRSDILLLKDKPSGLSDHSQFDFFAIPVLPLV